MGLYLLFSEGIRFERMKYFYLINFKFITLNQTQSTLFINHEQNNIKKYNFANLYY